MRIYPIPKDPTKTHLNVDDGSRCKLKGSLYQKIRLTKDIGKVTCGRCQMLMRKVQ